MPNCNDGEAADSILDRVLGLLDEQRMKESIDTQIDRALATFDWSRQVGDSSKEREFLQVVSEFASHMYKHGLPLPQTLSPIQATAEAIELLEHIRAGPGRSGYDDALLDFIHYGEEGLEMVLAEMAGMFKVCEREKHFRCVIGSHLDHLDWRTKCSVVNALWTRARVFLPEDLANCPVEQVAYVCDSVIRDYLQTQEGLRQVVWPFKQR